MYIYIYFLYKKDDELYICASAYTWENYTVQFLSRKQAESL